jgi:hypothetical protein
MFKHTDQRSTITVHHSTIGPSTTIRVLPPVRAAVGAVAVWTVHVGRMLVLMCVLWTKAQRLCGSGPCWVLRRILRRWRCVCALENTVPAHPSTVLRSRCSSNQPCSDGATSYASVVCHENKKHPGASKGLITKPSPYHC